MSRKKISAITTFMLLGLLFANTSLAADEIHSEPGLDSNRETFSTTQNEHVDPFTGGLSLVYTDMRFPGNGGLDLVVNRTYNSKRVYNGATNPATPDRSPLGYGWNIHFGRIEYQGFYVGVELQNGTIATAYNKSDSGGSDYVTKDQWQLYYNSGSTSTLTLTDGTKITFGQQGNDGYKYATKIEKNGNAINIYYRYNSSTESAYSVDYVTDSVGRTINFIYEKDLAGLGPHDSFPQGYPTQNDYLREITASYPGFSLSIFYDYVKVNPDPPNNVSNPPEILSKVTLPEGDFWQYQYETANIYHELKTVTTPYGGTITYQFEKFFKAVDYFRAVSEKTVSGTGTWTFDYEKVAYDDDYTTIVAPDGLTTTYRFNGYGSQLDFYAECWKFGRVKSKKVELGASVISFEMNEWIKSSSNISPRPDIVTGYCNTQDTYMTLLSEKTITRDGKTYITDYGASNNFDVYGNPQTINETGDSTRTTTITYWYNTTANIVKNKPDTITVSGSFPGSFTTDYGYDTYGNLTSLNRYGVETIYTYDTTTKNLKTQKDANLKTTTYTWQYGRIKSIQNPIYTVNKTINPDGTVASITNGRVYTTSYAYDDNLRLTQITPHIGNPTSITYESDNSTKTVSKGGYSTIYTYDGLGREIESLDSKGVRKGTWYKASGLKDEVTSNVGDDTYFDDHGRVERIVHEDLHEIGYSYNLSNVTITDEANKTTTQYYTAFGDPDEKILTKVTDANLKSTLYEYNIQGSLTKITQGALVRDFSYSTKNFLTSETNPETGTITYGRDNVGNMTSIIDGEGTKTYGYDDINRLDYITYSGGTIDYIFDNADNLDKLISPDATIDPVYDAINRMTSKTVGVASGSYTTGYTYDLNSNLTKIDYPTNLVVNYTYNSKNQVISVSGFGATISPITYYTSTPHIGLPKDITYSNGVTTNYTYDLRNTIDGIQAGSDVLNLVYGYDIRGNLKSIDDDLNTANNKVFGYDDLNRLTTFSGPWGTGINEGIYSYDDGGNRKTKKITGVTDTYNYNASLNRLSSISGGTSISYGYNTDGDVTSVTDNGTGYNLVYDPFHNLNSYKLGTTPVATFTYDGKGQRVTKKNEATNQTTVYHYDEQGNVISETDPQGGLKADYVFLHGKMVSKIENNTFPVASDDTDTTNEDTPVTISVLANDNDPDGDLLSLASFGQPAHGSTTLSGNDIIYTPDANYNGSDSFTYVVDDGFSGTDTGTVTITVNPGNDNPVATNSLVFASALPSLSDTLGANDIDGDTLTYTIVTNPVHGTVIIDNPTNGAYTYNQTSVGTDTFTFKVNDGTVDSNSATVTITHHPVAAEDNPTTNEDTEVLIDVLFNDSDPDKDSLNIVSLTQPTKGTATIVDGEIRYNPSLNINGTYAFTYTINDGYGGTAIANVNVTVNSVNDFPVANRDTANVNFGSSITISVLDNDKDADGDVLTVNAIITLPANGTATINANNVIYTPNINYAGPDYFKYQISDGAGGSATATVDIMVKPKPTLIVAKDGTGTGIVQTIGQPGGIDYGSDNTELFAYGTVVTLRGTGDPGSTLTGWSVSDGVPTGECPGLGDCVVTMTADKTVTATFTNFSVVTVLTPKEGELIPGGFGYTIRWGAPANAATYVLGYSFGAGSPWKTIATGVTGNQYEWIYPDVIPNYGALYVAVIAYDSNGINIGSDISGAAERYSVAILTPSAAGISLTAGTSYDITWDLNLIPSTVVNSGLWYQTAPGTGWKLITVLANDDTGSYTWTIPVETTTEALVGVIFYDALGEVLYMDVSDNDFSIVVP